MTSEVSRRSGEGLSDGAISELAASFDVRQGLLVDPAAEEVLKHPALRPLLRQAAVRKIGDASAA